MGKQYAIIGMGRFGSSIANRLYEAGNEVLGIDKDEDRIEESKDYVTHAVIADTTEENALRELGIRNFDVVVVSIGNDIHKHFNHFAVKRARREAYRGEGFE